MPDDVDDVRVPRPGAGDDGERGDGPPLRGETAVGPPGAAPLPIEASEQAHAVSTIFVPDEEPRGGATMFVADEGPRPADGTLLSFPPDDRRPSVTGAARLADIASVQVGGTLLSFPEERGGSGETATSVPRGALPRRAVRIVASLALVAVLVALTALAYSTLHASVGKETRGAGADGEPPARSAAGGGIEARARCEQRLDGRGITTATVTCDVSNRGPVWARARVTAWLDGPGGARRVGAGKALLAPEERTTLRFEGPAPGGAGDACDCRVEALR